MVNRSEIMKRGLLICLLMFCALMGMDVAAKTDIVVASFNIRYDNEGDGQNSWRYRKDYVNSLIRFYEFDIFGIQEGLINQVRDIERLEEYGRIGVGRDDGAESGEHAAVFYKKERFEMMDSGNFWLSETPEKPSFGWDAQCRRICSWGKFREKNSGEIFFFFSVHFDHIGKKARVESSKLLMSRIKQIAGDMPVVCVGDFNGTPDSEHIKMLKDGGVLLDSREKSLTPPYGTEGTTSRFDVNDPQESRIDYIFVTPNVSVLKYGTLNEAQHRRYPSDHFPIMAKLNL